MIKATDCQLYHTIIAPLSTENWKRHGRSILKELPAFLFCPFQIVHPPTLSSWLTLVIRPPIIHEVVQWKYHYQLTFLYDTLVMRNIVQSITVTSQWVRWRLKSPASGLLIQPFIFSQIKENTKASRHWPLCWEFTGDRWIPRTNGQLRRKCFHLMTSSCEKFHVTLAEVADWYLHIIYNVTYKIIKNQKSMVTAWLGNLFRITDPFGGNPPATGKFPSRIASNLELWLPCSLIRTVELPLIRDVNVM